MIMPSCRECICCCEIDRMVMKKEEDASEISCITDHEGFESVCLNVWVLQAAYFSYRYHYTVMLKKRIFTSKLVTDVCAILLFSNEQLLLL